MNNEFRLFERKRGMSLIKLKTVEVFAVYYPIGFQKIKHWDVAWIVSSLFYNNSIFLLSKAENNQKNANNSGDFRVCIISRSPLPKESR